MWCLEWAMDTVAQVIEAFNFILPGGRWHLFEFCDLALVPPFIKWFCQDTLTAQWTKRLPIIQRQPPAALAAKLMSDVLNSLDDGSSKWRVIDFCSGGGGPTPYIEKHVNRQRRRSGKPTIPFQLSDLYPNIDAWMYHAAHSESLTFIPQAVDATNPPFAAISYTTPGDKEAAAQQGFVHDGRKVLRLFCLSFHHFDDEGARRVIKSSLETSDALVIIELQDRRIATLLAMAMEALLVLIVTIFWYPFDWLRLLFTYIMPVLPAIHCFDGLVSCLRTRTFEEFTRLLSEVTEKQYLGDDKVVVLTQRAAGWSFTTMTGVHTWPCLYMNAIVGKKVTDAG